jgi:hypothetical protein
VGKTAIWWTILGLTVFTDILYLPVALALYLALREVNKNIMLMASSLTGLFVALDMAVTWSHYASILTLYEQYSMTMDQAKRRAYVAAAEYASAMLTSPLEIVYAIVILSSGILLTSRQGSRNAHSDVYTGYPLKWRVDSIADRMGSRTDRCCTVSCRSHPALPSLVGCVPRVRQDVWRATESCILPVSLPVRKEARASYHTNRGDSSGKKAPIIQFWVHPVLVQP